MFVNVFVDLKIFINIQTRGWWGINQKWAEVGLLLFRKTGRLVGFLVVYSQNNTTT